MSRGELTIKTSLLSALGSHPASKYPATEPNWASEAAKTAVPPSPDAKTRKNYPVSISIPADSITVPSDLKIKPGVALQACYAGSWNPITAISENQDGTLNVRWDKYGSGFDCSMLRSQLIISKSLATQLRNNPDSITSSTPPLKRKNYTVSLPIPPDSVLVPETAVLEANTKLRACWAGSWNPITFLSHASDGSLNVHWDDYSDAFNCSMLRNQLIIRKSDLNMTTLPPASEELRVFKDKTGRFSVKAKILDQTDTEVVLLTETGKKVRVPLNKLCDADQEFLRSTKDAVNPFE